MPAPHGFHYESHMNGTVHISHRGRQVTVLRGSRAQEFLGEVEGGDDQEVMARWTGNYKRGNERMARNHPRNR